MNRPTFEEFWRSKRAEDRSVGALVDEGALEDLARAAYRAGYEKAAAVARSLVCLAPGGVSPLRLEKVILDKLRR